MKLSGMLEWRIVVWNDFHPECQRATREESIFDLIPAKVVRRPYRLVKILRRGIRYIGRGVVGFAGALGSSDGLRSDVAIHHSIHDHWPKHHGETSAQSLA